MNRGTAAQHGEPDGLQIRLQRLVNLFRVPSGSEGPPFWMTLDAYLRSSLNTGKSLNEAERFLSTLLGPDSASVEPSARDVDLVLRYIDEAERYLDLTRPRFESEASLLLAQLDKMGVSAFRMCRAYMREFDRVEALELLVDVTSSVAPRAQEIESGR